MTAVAWDSVAFVTSMVCPPETWARSLYNWMSDRIIDLDVKLWDCETSLLLRNEKGLVNMKVTWMVWRKRNSEIQEKCHYRRFNNTSDFSSNYIEVICRHLLLTWCVQSWPERRFSVLNLLLQHQWKEKCLKMEELLLVPTREPRDKAKQYHRTLRLYIVHIKS